MHEMTITCPRRYSEIVEKALDDSVEDFIQNEVPAYVTRENKLFSTNFIMRYTIPAGMENQITLLERDVFIKIAPYTR